MKHVIRPTLGDVGVQRLQAGTNPCDRGVVVGTLLIDNRGETPLPLVQVVGHVRQEIGIAAILLAHHAVFVVAEFGGFQPHGAVMFVGIAVFLQALDGFLYLAIFVQR